MDYLIIEDKTITNIIVCDSDAVAAEFGAVPWYEGAAIGGAYAPRSLSRSSHWRNVWTMWKSPRPTRQRWTNSTRRFT